MSIENFEEDSEYLVLDALYSVILIAGILWWFNLYILTFIYLGAVVSMLFGTDEEEDISEFQYSSWADEDLEDYVEQEVWLYEDEIDLDSLKYSDPWEVAGYDFLAFDLIELMHINSVPSEEGQQWFDPDLIDKEEVEEEKQFIADLIKLNGLSHNVDFFLENFNQIPIKNKPIKLPYNTTALVNRRIVLEKALVAAVEDDPEFFKFKMVGARKSVHQIMSYRYHVDQLRNTWIKSGLYDASDAGTNVLIEQIRDIYHPLRKADKLVELNCNHFQWYDHSLWGYYNHNIGILSDSELNLFLKYRIHLLQSLAFHKQAMGRAGYAMDVSTGWIFNREDNTNISLWWDFDISDFSNDYCNDYCNFRYGWMMYFTHIYKNIYCKRDE